MRSMTEAQRKFALAAAIATVVVASAAVGFLGVKPTAAQDGFSTKQREEVKELVREYILENPEIISEAIMALQQREEDALAAQQTQALDTHREALLNPPEGTVIGNPNGDVTVVEFFDYNCGYCKQMFSTVSDVLDEDDNLRMVMKEFPILGPNSLVAARAALASREQGKYAEFHIAMLRHRGSLTQDTIMSIARDIGLNVGKLQEDMKNEEI
ncbi:MAG: DsbA family protein, partial [Rhodospirillaceae bacterium]